MMVDELKGVFMVLGSWLFSRLVPIADFMQGMLLLDCTAAKTLLCG